MASGLALAGIQIEGLESKTTNKETPMSSPPSGDGPTGSPPTGSEGQGPIDWQAQDWEDLMPRLLLLASSRLARLRGSLPRMAEAEDFVNDAILKSMAGTRVWNRASCTLLQHLAGVIVSDISHTARSSDNRCIRSNPDRANGGTTWPPEMTDQAPDQEHATVWLSEQRRLLEHLRGLDPMMGRMAELMLVHDVCENSRPVPSARHCAV